MSESLEKLKAPKKYLLLFFGLIICAICIYYIAVSFQWEKIWAVFKEANLLIFLLGSIISLILYWLIRCLRWFVLLREENQAVPFFKLYLYTAITVSFSTITPFQAGEALKVELLKKHNANRLSGYTNFAIERFFDILTILLFAMIGFSGEFGSQYLNYVYLIVLSLVFLSIICVIAINFLPFALLDKVRAILKERIKFGVVIQVAGLTVVSWILTGLGWYFALQSIGINLSFSQTALLLSLTTLTSILSFVPGAVGVSELSISTILAKIGTADTLAQTGALAIRCYALIILALGFLHVLCLKFYERKAESK